MARRWIKYRNRIGKLNPWLERLARVEKTMVEQEEARIKFKAEYDELEKEAVRTVRTYGVVKGLGEARHG